MRLLVLEDNTEYYLYGYEGDEVVKNILTIQQKKFLYNAREEVIRLFGIPKMTLLSVEGVINCHISNTSYNSLSLWQRFDMWRKEHPENDTIHFIITNINKDKS